MVGQAGLPLLVNAFLLLGAPAVAGCRSRSGRHCRRGGNAKPVANLRLGAVRIARAITSADHTWLCWEWLSGRIGSCNTLAATGCAGWTDLGRRTDCVGWAGFVVADSAWDDWRWSDAGHAEAAMIEMRLASMMFLGETKKMAYQYSASREVMNDLTNAKTYCRLVANEHKMEGRPYPQV